MEDSMKNRKKLALAGLLIIVLSILMVSCGSRPTPEPTVDVNVLATNAAQTIEARFTETALAKPTDTPQPTYTPVSYTPTTSSAPITLPTAGTGGSVSIPTIAQQPTAIVNLPTATLSAVGDKAVWADQSIKDGTHFAPGESADLTWYITNVGTTTWTTDYSVRFFTGTNFAKAGNTRYYLPKPVAPQETGQVTIDIVAPTTPGEYKMAWVLSNAEDHNFYTVDITIIVD
jgi:hypothetical protein